VYVPRWELKGFDHLEDRVKCRLILTMVRALIDVNLYELPLLRLPGLYDSGVEYEWQDPNQDQWKDCAQVMTTGGGSCNSLVAWRVAELRLRGESCGPFIQTDRQQTSRGPLEVFHCILWRGTPYADLSRRQWECPSRFLGMPAIAPE
jgi:hypothetical protein